MHGLEDFSSPAPVASGRPWYRQLNRYHWFVLAVAALGWLFDCLDQQLFVLARPAAMVELIPDSTFPNDKELNIARRTAGDYATSIFIAGWALGGLIFGMLGDRMGRAKTMLVTILLYSIFTGFSSFATGPWDFAAYRFLTGLGVGGEFAVGVSLVAEVMPDAARPYTLALLQALSAFGNMSAAFINLGLGAAQEHGALKGLEIFGWQMSPWRIMFMIGAVPAFLVLFIMRRLKEPEKWQKASHQGKATANLGSYRELFGDPELRRRALLGLLLGCAGVIGLWSVGFFTMDLIRFVREKPVALNVYSAQLKQARSKEDQPRAAHLEGLIASVKDPTVSLSADEKSLKEELAGAVSGRLSRWPSFASIAINAGAFFGMFGFGALAQRIGRKPTFALALLAACFSTVAVFYYLEDLWQLWVMVPVMGFCQLSLFAGYAIYFPELFPTRLRSTGTSFCYNVGRFVAAFGPLVKAQLEKAFVNTSEPLRYAGCTMCIVFLLGLLALPFLPETKGRPLPE